MNPIQSGKKDHFNLPLLLLLVLVAATTMTAYHRTLFNWFAGDDYCHLAWLADAAKNPRLLLDNFTGPWLGGIVTHFYRPMISIVTFLDYLCWKDNATGYHITNLAGLLLASLFLFFILDAISKIAARDMGTTRRLWALSSAALFALYPLHPEAVSWIIGRVDVISTLFYTGSLCSYIWWRMSKKTICLVLALSAAILGLLSKEMVVTLPAMMFVFELLFGNLLNSSSNASANAPKQPSKLAAVADTFLAAFKNTAPFWLLLACYAIVRRLALGTFVGGYDVSWSLVADSQLIMHTWQHGLQMLFVPVNHAFIGARDWHTRAWELFLIVSATSLTASLLTNAIARRLFAFLLIWLVVALVPLYNIFAIGNELQGGRFGYLPSAPLSGLLLLGYFFMNAGLVGSTLLRWSVPCFLLLSANILYINNEAWHNCGVQLKAIERGLSREISSVPNDSQVLLLNLPDDINGAYACRNASYGILFRVGAKIDPNRCLEISRFQNAFPCGFLKDSISANAGRIVFLWWDPARMDFIRINPTASLAGNYSEQKEELLKPIAAPGVSYKRLADGSLYIESTKLGVRPRVDIESLTGRNCWDTDFISMQVIVGQGGSIGGACGGDFIYANTSNPKLGNLNYRAHASFIDKSGEQSLLFALRGDEAWTFGGKISGCAVLLPDQCKLIIKSVKAVNPYQVIPRLSFANGDYFHSKGYINLGRDHVQQQLQFDSSQIAGATKTMVELSRRNVFFEYPNAANRSNTTWHFFVIPSLKGQFVLDLKQFPESGFYSLRLRAIDANNKNIGLASDHVVIQVSR